MNGTDPPNAYWRKSRYSNHEASCVEVADLDGGQRAVRDSKNAAGPALLVGPAQWFAFTAAIRSDDFR